MRHPFWQWSGWLSIGLTGCLHGQDWRAAVTQPTTRPVADRRESPAQLKVVSPLRKKQPMVARPTEAPTSPTIVAPAAATGIAQQLPSEVTLPTAAKSEVRSRNQHVAAAGFELPPIAPVSRSPAGVELSRSETFAEFERTIPQRRSSIAKSIVPPVESIEVIVPSEREPDQSIELPVITPAGALISAKPAAAQAASSRKLGPESPSSDDRQRVLISKSVVLAKELPDVTDTNTSTSLDSPSANAAASIRPQDVSVLVTQVFEDLRQRRLNDARQRTEWLKQLVRKRAPASPANVEADESVLEKNGERSGQPRRLEVDPQATAVEKLASETSFDDEDSTSRK